MSRAPLPLVLLASLASPAALAQGLPDARTGIQLPTSQGAAVEDATALLVNPAGLAHVEGFELNLGAFVRGDGATGQTDVDGTLVFTPFGLGLGLGGGLSTPEGRAPRLRLSGALAAGDQGLSSGIALHSITALAGGGQPDVLVDVGAQLRPARWFALGLALEGLGAQDAGPASARVGVSLRPLEEMLSLGVDVRAIPGSRDPSSPRYAGELVLVPAATARIDLGGLSLSAGASVVNLGPVVAAPPSVELMAALELNGKNLGLWGLAGADGVGGAVQRGAGGVRLRTSSAQWAPIFPDAGHWLSLTLVGDGVPASKRERDLLAQLMGSEPDALAVIATLDNAAQDPSIEGVVLHLEDLSLGWARLAELRLALSTLRAGGKKVIVHLDDGGDDEVFVASAADRVYLTPAGNLDLNGLRAEMLYFADTLAKVGVEAEAVSAGRYKSAPRQFTANEPSPEELEVTNALLDEAYGALVQMIAAGRGLELAAVKAAIDQGGLTAQAALAAKLIDGLAYKDELPQKAEELAQRPVRLEEGLLEREARDVRWHERPRIAVIPITGTISMSGGALFLDAPGAKDIMQAIERAARDDDVKAIVLRVDSPGGDALASDLLWRAVMKAREKKPVVASMGDVAASGGYYVAAAADTIFAERNTVTGSIGVFGLLFNAERLAEDLGVRVHTVERGALPGPSSLRALSEAERAAMQVSVDATYERFLDAIISGRGELMALSKEQLRPLAEGRVWTGAQAKDHKLVDAIGGILSAVADARTRAGIDADEEIVLDIISGDDDDLVQLAKLAQAFAPTHSLDAAVRFILGDPEALAFALQHEGSPLAVAPMRVRLR